MANPRKAGYLTVKKGPVLSSPSSGLVVDLRILSLLLSRFCDSIRARSPRLCFSPGPAGPSNIKGSTFYFILGEDTLFMFNNERVRALHSRRSPHITQDFAAKGAFPLDDWVKTSNINDDKLTFDIIKLDNSFVRFKVCFLAFRAFRC